MTRDSLALAAWLAVTPIAATGQAANPLDPSLDIDQYVHRSWTVEDGLPNNAVFAVLQTSAGYLWVGTRGGLSRFDGVRFTNFTTENTPAFRASWVRALAQTPDSTLWIGFDPGGVVAYRNGRFTQYGPADGIGRISVPALSVDSSGRLWVGTDEGLYRWEAPLFVEEELPGGMRPSIVSLDAAADGQLLVGTRSDGVFLLEGGRFRQLATFEEVGNRIVAGVVLRKDGSPWFTAYRLDIDGFTQRPLGAGGNVLFEDRSGLLQVRVLFEDRSGTLWAGVDPLGLVRIDGEGSEAFGLDEGLGDHRVFDIHEDRDGNLWVGTYGSGLHQFTSGRLTPYTTRQGLSTDVSRSIYRDPDGVVWAAGDAGLDRWTGERFAPAGLPDIDPSWPVRAILGNSNGDLWVGTAQGLLVIEGETERWITVEDGLPSNGVATLFEDEDGALWIGTDVGVARWRNGEMTSYPLRWMLPGFREPAFYRDRAGVLWLGSQLGLLRFDGEDFEMVREGASIRAIYQDVGGDRWLGTEGQGLWRMRGDTIFRFTREEGLYDDYVYVIFEDDRGRFWTCEDRGISVVDKDELNALAGGNEAVLYSSVGYGVADGMRRVECNGRRQPSAWQDTDGDIWFPTVGGVVRLDVHDETVIAPELRPRIEEITSGGVLLDGSAGLELRPERRDLEIQFTAIDFYEPTKLQFRHRLSGAGSDWIEDRDRRFAQFQNLEPGSYTFEVQATRQPGVWNGPIATFEFTALPYVYETTWFLLLMCAGVLSLAFGAHRGRLGLVEASRARLEKTVEARTRELRDANQDLEAFSYSVSHDLKAPLRAIRGLTEIVLEESADRLDAEGRRLLGIVTESAASMTTLIEDLLRFSRISRHSLAVAELDMNRVVASVMSEIEGQFEETEREVSIGSLPPARGDLTLIRQVWVNLLSNALKFSGSREVGRIEVDGRTEGEESVYSVKDNGAGFDMAHAGKLFTVFDRLHGREEYEGTGIGLSIVKRIVDRHGGRVWAEGKVGEGATFWFTLPASEEEP